MYREKKFGCTSRVHISSSPKLAHASIQTKENGTFTPIGVTQCRHNSVSFRFSPPNCQHGVRDFRTPSNFFPSVLRLTSRFRIQMSALFPTLFERGNAKITVLSLTVQAICASHCHQIKTCVCVSTNERKVFLLIFFVAVPFPFRSLHVPIHNNVIAINTYWNSKKKIYQVVEFRGCRDIV